ncbi:MAG: hypothetical protein ACP5QA_13815 [Phycisphaerae bacterium]
MAIDTACALTGREALRHVLSLGRLGPWVLEPRVIELAAEEASRRGTPLRNDDRRPSREDVAGACVALFVKPEHSCASPLLRKCFGIPLVWQASAQHPGTDCAPGEAALPIMLQQLAADVRRHICPRHSHEGWSLRHRFSTEAMGALAGLLHEEADCTTASLPADSAFLPLAISLQLARQGGRFECVWATGCFDSYRGIRRVEGIAAKHAFVREIVESWGLTKPVQFFIPEDNMVEVTATAAVVEVIPLPPLDHDPHRSLHELTLNALRVPLQQLHSPPPDTASFEERVNFWVEHATWDKAAAGHYYREHIFKDEVALIRTSLPQIDTAGIRLATICEHARYDTLDMLLGVLRLRADQVVLFYSGRRPDPPGVTHIYELPPHEITDPQALRNFIRARLDGLAEAAGGSSHYIFDITAGTKCMSVGLYLAAQAGDYLSVLTSTGTDTFVRAAGRHRPGRQTLVVQACDPRV